MIIYNKSRQHQSTGQQNPESMPNNRLTDSQANQMLKLEQLFHNRYLTPEFLHQLISIYVKAIESFNEDFVFMRGYFMEKMQFVLSSPEIITMLQGGGSAIDQLRQTIRITQRVMPQQPQRTPQQENKQQKQQKQKIAQDRFANYKQQNHHHHNHTKEQHHHYHYDQSKNSHTALKIDMKMKLMREVQENTKNMKKQLNQANKKLEMNEEKVKDITKNQEQMLNQRLAKRKKRLRKKSVQIKAKVVNIEGQLHEPQQEPVIHKQQLKQAQRELTQAVFKFTVRMTKKQSLKNSASNGVGRVKKAKDMEDDILLQQQDQQQKVEKIMKKNKVTQPQQVTQGRVKTTRRHLDSDEDE